MKNINSKTIITGLTLIILVSLLYPLNYYKLNNLLNIDWIIIIFTLIYWIYIGFKIYKNE